jgi:transcriptional regulator with XRE-family HTH domain
MHVLLDDISQSLVIDSKDPIAMAKTAAKPKMQTPEPPPVAAKPTRNRRRRPTVLASGPHPIDVYVGKRIRMARLLAGVTQSTLAAGVKLTFQQIQKYERGANRVSCSMLSEFAEVLGRPVPWFFAEGDGKGAEPSKGAVDPVIGERQRLTYELTSNFTKIASERAREHLVGLVRAMAESEAE